MHQTPLVLLARLHLHRAARHAIHTGAPARTSMPGASAAARQLPTTLPLQQAVQFLVTRSFSTGSAKVCLRHTRAESLPVHCSLMCTVGTQKQDARSPCKPPHLVCFCWGRVTGRGGGTKVSLKHFRITARVESWYPQ